MASINEFERIFQQLIQQIRDLERRVDALENEEYSGVDVVNQAADIETPRENHLILDSSDGTIKRYTENKGWEQV